MHNGNSLEKLVTDTCDFAFYSGRRGIELEKRKGWILDVENNRKLKGKLHGKCVEKSLSRHIGYIGMPTVLIDLYLQFL
jgi:hypothetical protein